MEAEPEKRRQNMEGSNLPEELWTIISKKLNSTIDVVRFRSIHRLFRSLLPPASPSNTHCISYDRYFLLQTKIYRIQPSTSSPSSNKGWLIRVFQSNSSKLYLLDLFTNERLRTEETINKVLNLMNFRVVELFQLYTPSDLKGEIDFNYFCSIRKVIFSSIEGHCMVFALYWGKAMIVSNMDEKTYTMLEDDGGENKCFDDMILYKGQLYVVDKMGTIFWFNALSFKLVQFSPKNLYCCEENRRIRVNSKENKKQLVEYDGSLYVVDLYINDERYYKWGYFLKDVFVEVYKLDQEWGKWLKVKDLDDVSFVLSKDSNFALLAQDYYGCEGNCIYFYFDHKASCFNLKNLETKPANIFWPCPTLFYPTTN